MEQQMQQQGSLPMVSPMNFNSGNMVYMTNLDRELQRLEQSLRGVIVDTTGNVIGQGVRLTNERGIKAIIGQVSSIVNTNTVMSNLDEQNISALGIGLLNDLCLMLMMNKRAFEIQSDDARSAILSRCLNLALITLKRGFQGDDKRFWKGTIQEINYGVSGSQGQQKQGLLQKFSPTNWLKS